MAIALTQGQKNALDSFLAVVGLLVGWISSNVAAFPADDQALASLIGLVGGYAVSDAVSFLDTGTLPTAAVVATQTQSVLDTPTVTTFLQNQIAKLPTADQALPQAALATIQAALQKASQPTPLMGTPVPAAPVIQTTVTA